jgi:iron-sulfur cluster assembly protein
MAEEKTYSITVTPEAAEQIKKQLEKRGTPSSYLRLGLKGGGCSGFSYVLQYEDPPFEARDLFFHSNDIDIVIDPKSILYLNGCTLDWEKNLLKQGFKFINPNEKTSCGCGHSFSV